MAVFTRDGAKENIRNLDGKRVFYLADGDHLTPSARQWLTEENIAIIPPTAGNVKEYRTLDGAILRQKPEHMTHLRGNTLVRKDHPRIKFRGMVDFLEAELLLAIKTADESTAQKLLQVLNVVRQLIRADVLDEPVEIETICGLTMQQLRERSHYPHKYYEQPHFMPSEKDSVLLLTLNRVRTVIRQTELAAFDAFHDPEGAVTRKDILQTLNRLSSMLWIMMIEKKREERNADRS